MFTIRRKQLGVLSANAGWIFERRMAAHLRQNFPEQSDTLGPAELDRVVQQGIERAAAHGIVLQRDVCKFIDLMMVFGRGFDTDPQLPWASATLHEEFLKERPTEKISRLCDVAMEHVLDGDLKKGASRHG